MSTIHALKQLRPKEPEQTEKFYADRVKVYPARVRGLFRRVKWLLLAACLAVYYFLPWLRWDRGPGAPDQAVLVDLPNRRAYFFFIEIWPQEVYFLTGLLILGAIGLFLVTSLFGRVWCGYACPQTVWTDLFMWVERLIEGDRNARIKLDQQPWGARKAGLKVAKHFSWLVIAAATGGAWVMYFNDAPTVVAEIFTGRAGYTVYVFVGLFTATTYVLAGWAREQVCTYMCPWPRFQAAMLDENSAIVSYRAWRGEPRGKHKAGASWEGHGDCVDCGQCVAVCPTGIDIRDGQQLECIGCGLCIDACNTVMDKVGRPRGLIALDTLAHVNACAAATVAMPPGPTRVDAAAAQPVRLRVFRPRTLIYAGVLGLVAAVMLVALMLRTTVELSVQRDRAPLFVTLSDGSIRNSYTVKVLNKQHATPVHYLAFEGLPGATLAAAGVEMDARGWLALPAKSDAVATWRVHVSVPRASLARDSTQVQFVLHDASGAVVARYGSVFLGPHQ